MASVFYQRIRDVLDLIVDRITSLPESGGLVSTNGSGGGLTVEAIRPITPLAVAEDDAEVTTLKGSQTRFIDARDSTVWRYENSTWTNSPYDGAEEVLRPQTLCFSPTSGKLYYFNAALELVSVNLTTNTTAP